MEVQHADLDPKTCVGVVEGHDREFQEEQHPNTQSVEVEVVDGFTQLKGHPGFGFKEIDQEELQNIMRRLTGWNCAMIGDW